MASLSISKAWDEGARFAAREFRLLFPIAFLFLALPPLLFQLIVPPPAGFDSAATTLPTGELGAYAFVGLGTGLVELVLSTLGSLAITHLALRPGVSVGESFSVASRRLLPTMGAVLIILIAAVLVFFGLSLAFGASFLALLFGSGGANADPGPAAAGLIGAALLFLLLFAVLALALGAKLLPMTAVSVAEEKGPLGMIARSWQLTKGHFWKLVATLLIIGIVYMIGAGALFMMIGAIVWATIGNPAMSTTAAFVVALLAAFITAVIAPFFLAFTARIYAQLTGRVGEVGEVFR
jgi:hypothetical protein